MILITGARGHIGNVLARHLYEKGYTDLRLMVRGGNVAHIEKYAKEVVYGDICDAKAVDDAVRGCSDVFHVAGLISMSAKNKQLLHDINVGGVCNVISACKRHGIKRLVYVSSVHALSPSADLHVDETIDAQPEHRDDEYARTKLAATLQVLRDKELDAVVVYPTGVIGPHDHLASMSGEMFRKYIKPQWRQLYFDGRFDFVDVRDVAEGLYLAWQRGKRGEGYILTGEPCSIKDMIVHIKQCTGCRCRMLRVPLPLVKACAKAAPLVCGLIRKTPVITSETVGVMVSNVRISGEKAQRELGFCPRPLAQTIRDAVEWYRCNTGAL